MEVFWHKYQSPLGEITMASDGAVIIGLWFAGQKHFGAKFGEPAKFVNLPIFEETTRWLDKYFRGENPGKIPPIKFSGTPFQMEVWRILQTVSYANLITYREIAEQIAERRGIAKMSARAVGSAVGRNPISILVPCHRVVGSGGKLTGYAGGIERKIELLRLEKSIDNFIETQKAAQI